MKTWPPNFAGGGNKYQYLGCTLLCIYEYCVSLHCCFIICITPWLGIEGLMISWTAGTLLHRLHLEIHWALSRGEPDVLATLSTKRRKEKQQGWRKGAGRALCNIMSKYILLLLLFILLLFLLLLFLCCCSWSWSWSSWFCFVLLFPSLIYFVLVFSFLFLFLLFLFFFFLFLFFIFVLSQKTPKAAVRL